MRYQHFCPFISILINNCTVILYCQRERIQKVFNAEGEFKISQTVSKIHPCLVFNTTILL